MSLKTAALHTATETFPAVDLRRAGKNKEAISALDALIASTSLEPFKKGWAMVEKGLNLQILGDSQAGEAILREVIELEVEDPLGTLLPSALYELARCVDQLKRYGEAKRLFIQAIELSKAAKYPLYDKDLRILMITTRLAECLFHSGNKESAQAMLKGNVDNLYALTGRINPNLHWNVIGETVVALNRLADVHQALGEFDAALKITHQAFALDAALKYKT